MLGGPGAVLGGSSSPRAPLEAIIAPHSAILAQHGATLAHRGRSVGPVAVASRVNGRKHAEEAEHAELHGERPHGSSSGATSAQ